MNSLLSIWVQGASAFAVYHARLELLVYGTEAANTDPSALRLRFANSGREVMGFSEVRAELGAQHKPAKIVLLLGDASTSVLRATFHIGHSAPSAAVAKPSGQSTTGPRARPRGRTTDHGPARGDRGSVTTTSPGTAKAKKIKLRSGGHNRRTQRHRNPLDLFSDTAPLGDRRSL